MQHEGRGVICISVQLTAGRFSVLETLVSLNGTKRCTTIRNEPIIPLRDGTSGCVIITDTCWIPAVSDRAEKLEAGAGNVENTHTHTKAEMLDCKVYFLDT